jgi:nucleotide-binding universal stress UspA family protein
MAVDQLIIGTFEQCFKKYFYDELVVGKLAHSEFKNGVKRGDEVDVIMPGTVTLGKYDGEGDLPAPEKITTSATKVRIDQGEFFHFYLQDIEKKQMNSASLLLNKFETIFKNYGISGVKKAILQGNPSTELIKYLAKENIDLVVCGTRNHKKLPKFLLNSVSKRILESTKSDVLIVRQNNL